MNLRIDFFIFSLPRLHTRSFRKASASFRDCGFRGRRKHAEKSFRETFRKPSASFREPVQKHNLKTGFQVGKNT